MLDALVPAVLVEASGCGSVTGKATREAIEAMQAAVIVAVTVPTAAAGGGH